MKLAEACEPFFQYVCRLNRGARRGVSPDAAQARAEIRAKLAECRDRATAAALADPYDKIELVLLYFADYMIRSGKLDFANQWDGLAREKGFHTGDEDFFDQLDAALKDHSESATERLGVFYHCIGLGFGGWYAGQPEYLRKKMLEISSRLAGQIDAGKAREICPEALQTVDRRTLFKPPTHALLAIVIAVLLLGVTVLAVNTALYHDSRATMAASLAKIADNRPAEPKK